MPRGPTQNVFLTDDAATARLGQLLAEAVRPGELVLLEGDLGAGKTALARAMIRTLLGDPELDVPSPSFALVQPYEAGDTAILHTDLHRLASAAEIEELGLFDDPDAIVLVEWPERAPDLYHHAQWLVRLSVVRSGGRRARIEGRRIAALALGL